MLNSQFIYVLESVGYGRLVLNGEGRANLPMGFDEQRISITRSSQFYGLFREFSTSLRFVTDGMNYIQNVYEKEGTEYVINIGIYEYQPAPVDKYYLYFAGLIDLSTYSFSETFIECDINESSLNRKIVSRDDVKVNLGVLETVEGEVMDVNPEVIVNLHERELQLIASYVKDPDVTDMTTSFSGSGTEAGLVFPFNIEISNIDNLNSNPYGFINTAGSLFWNKNIVASSIKITGILKGVINYTQPVLVPEAFFKIVIRKYSDDIYSVYEEGILFQHTATSTPQTIPFDIDLGTFDLDYYLNNIATNETVALILVTNYDLNFPITIEESTLNIVENQLFDSTDANGYLMHEVGDRITNTIADRQCFKSNFFGRTDIGYQVNGKGALTSAHSGKQIRAIPESKPTFTLSDWFKSVNAIWNLGMGIEYDEVSRPYIAVEEKKHFFSGEVIATIHNVNEIKKEVAREWIYNEVEVGYSKAEYEEVNGLEEYNNKFEWSTSINTIKNKLDLVSTLRGDGYGIEFARRLQFAETPTEDSKYDNDNFVVVVKQNGSNYQSARDEDYDIVENIFSPESAYNLDITPGRMIRNHGNVLRAGIEKYLDEPVKFRYAEQKANLKSQRIGESAITENEDIDSNTLGSPLWIAEKYTFESILTREQLAAITKNSGGIIKFSTTSEANTTKYYYGWILEIDAEDTTATWELLRVNTSSPDVVLVDPEGSTPTIPPIIIEPSDTFGIFEGAFEFIFSG